MALDKADEWIVHTPPKAARTLDMTGGFANWRDSTLSEMERGRQELCFHSLKQLLDNGLPLPKDAYLGTNIAGLSLNNYRHRDRNRDRMAIYALADAASTAEEKQLALAQANCSRRCRCKLPFCYVCT